jgi:hypothetical protein
MSRVLHRIIAGLALVCAVLCGNMPAFAAQPSPDVDAALARTEAHFANKEVHGDVGFLLGQAAKRRGRTLPMLKPLAHLTAENARAGPLATEYALWQMRNVSLPRLSFRLPPARAQGFDPAMAMQLSGTGLNRKALGEQGQIVFLVMGNAFACKAGGNAVEITGRPGYEYISTHQVFAVLVVAQRQCQPRDVLGQLLGLYVGRVRDEFELQMQQELLTDLQIERAAMLCMVGRCDLVPPPFFRRVLAAQGADGLWRLDDPLIKSGAMPVEHPTALAYFLLSHAPR